MCTATTACELFTCSLYGQWFHNISLELTSFGVQTVMPQTDQKLTNSERLVSCNQTTFFSLMIEQGKVVWLQETIVKDIIMLSTKN